MTRNTNYILTNISWSLWGLPMRTSLVTAMYHTISYRRFRPMIPSTKHLLMESLSQSSVKKKVSYWTLKGSRFGYHFKNLLRFEHNLVLSRTFFFSSFTNGFSLLKSSSFDTLSPVLLISSISHRLFLSLSPEYYISPLMSVLNPLMLHGKKSVE